MKKKMKRTLYRVFFYRESVQVLKWRNDAEFVICAYKICGSGPTP